MTLTAPSRPFRLILPDQKRLRDAFNMVLDQAGFEFSKPASRAASGTTRDKRGQLPDIETYELRSEAALVWLADGDADLAIVGQDALWEAAAKADAAPTPRKLLSMERISACSIWIAAKPETPIENIKDLESMRIATSYPELLQQILQEQGVRAGRIIAQKGGVESTIVAGRADAILEIVQSGESLRQNGLAKKLLILKSCAQLVRGPAGNEKTETLVSAFAARLRQGLEPRANTPQNQPLPRPVPAPAPVLRPLIA